MIHGKRKYGADMNEQTLIITKDIERKEYLGMQKICQVSCSAQVTHIGDWAFAGCKNLTAISIADPSCTLGKEVFLKCPKLKGIEVGEKKSWSRLMALFVKEFQTPELISYVTLRLPWHEEQLDHGITLFLNQPDEEGFAPFLAGGEEDYEDKDSDPAYYKQKRRRKKAEFIVERLLIEKEAPIARKEKELWCSYIRKHPDCLEVIFQEEERAAMRYHALEQEGLISEEQVSVLLEQVPPSFVECKALLLRRQESNRQEKDCFAAFTI